MVAEAAKLPLCDPKRTSDARRSPLAAPRRERGGAGEDGYRPRAHSRVLTNLPPPRDGMATPTSNRRRTARPRAARVGLGSSRRPTRAGACPCRRARPWWPDEARAKLPTVDKSVVRRLLSGRRLLDRKADLWPRSRPRWSESRHERGAHDPVPRGLPDRVRVRRLARPAGTVVVWFVIAMGWRAR